MLPDPRLGLPNPDVLKSAAFQRFQIGANDISEAAYYFTDTDAASQPLDGSGWAVHVLRFPGDRLPPAGPGGYWSRSKGWKTCTTAPARRSACTSTPI